MYLSIYLTIYLSINLSIYLSNDLSIYPSIYLSHSPCRRVNGTLIAGATTSELTLSNIQPASSGRYLCQQAFQFFVFVSSPARIARAPSNASVTQGTPVELRCNTQANIYPPVTINWLYQAINSLGEPTGERTSLSLAVLSDNLIYAGGQVLRFSSIQISDSGLFTCYASNTLGNVTATAMVTVNVRKYMFCAFSRALCVSTMAAVSVSRYRGYLLAK